MAGPGTGYRKVSPEDVFCSNVSLNRPQYIQMGTGKVMVGHELVALVESRDSTGYIRYKYHLQDKPATSLKSRATHRTRFDIPVDTNDEPVSGIPRRPLCTALPRQPLPSGD